MAGAIALFTRESVEEILAAGGSGNWVTSAERVRNYPYVVLVRNGRHPSSPSDTEHGTAFLVGRVSGVRNATNTAANGYPRLFIEIERYAPVRKSNAWSKSQNPVWYTELAKLGIDEDALHFLPMPHHAADGLSRSSVNKDHVLAEMKQEIGHLYGVPKSAIEIIIRL